MGLASKEKITAFVKLLNEGTEVYCPVPARIIKGCTIYLEQPADYDSTVDQLEFLPGEIVRCERRLLSEGNVLVAVEKINDCTLEKTDSGK